MSARQLLQLDHDFVMKGGRLNRPALAYETWGTLNARRDNCVLLFTGLSPSAHAASHPLDPSAGWWEDMIGADKPIDTQRYFVVCINSLGSCFGSTGPASINPSTGKVYRLDFPVLTVEDIANSAIPILAHLDVEQVHTVVGASMGGMTALSFALMHPERCQRLVSISSGSRSQPYAIALRSLQREIIRTDPLWNQGNYDLAQHGPVNGMRLARKLGMISYRSAEEWQIRFGRERSSDTPDTDNLFGINFEVESYLQNHAERFIGAFDANCYLYLSRAMDLFDAADHGGSLAASFTHLSLRSALVIGVSSDSLFPLQQQHELAAAMKPYVEDTQMMALDSIQGHDSFLVDMDQFRPAIAGFF
ncbi:MAG: homoserine O-acetyltransferase [Pseudomonadota bacterium]|nr:homoserine O-acetyltransferase [Pseudomonadota bacterium]